MTEYSLYIESGPKHKKTMVHVLGLLGCIAQGPTTEEALQATPEAIRLFLGFLKSHGEKVKPEADFTTKIAVHITEGSWIGQGDPPSGFEPDFQPMSEADLRVTLQHLEWLQKDFIQTIHDIPRKKMSAKPETGRTIHEIAEHVSESHGAYLRYLTGKVDGVSEALKAVREEGPDALSATLSDLWQLTNARLKILTAKERTAKILHGQLIWTARRCMRRMLEHNWEHSQEIAKRLDQHS
jgi:predicted RNase H-like HicB family nuclease/uncharacterized damage-inducible protein DinB